MQLGILFQEGKAVRKQRYIEMTSNNNTVNMFYISYYAKKVSVWATFANWAVTIKYKAEAAVSKDLIQQTNSSCPLHVVIEQLLSVLNKDVKSTAVCVLLV